MCMTCFSSNGTGCRWRCEGAGEVVTELEMAAGLISRVVEGLDADQLARRCLCNNRCRWSAI